MFWKLVWRSSVFFCFFKDFYDTFWWFVIISTYRLIKCKCSMAHSTVKASNNISSYLFLIKYSHENVLFNIYGVIRSNWWQGIQFSSSVCFGVASFAIRLHISLSARKTFNDGNSCRSLRLFVLPKLWKNGNNQLYMSQNLPIRKIKKI